MALDLDAAVAAANALPLAPEPFSQGLTAADFAAQHEAHGETFRYWEATPQADATDDSNADGNLFVEVELSGNGHGYFHTTKKEVVSEQFGLVPRGSSMMSCLPGVVELTPGGRMARTGQVWAQNVVITRGAGDTDPLPQRFVQRIWGVTLADGMVADAADYEAVSADSPNDNDKGGIRWLDNAPAAGTRYTVKMGYHPLYAVQGELIQGEPNGADGQRLPQRILLKKERE